MWTSTISVTPQDVFSFMKLPSIFNAEYGKNYILSEIWQNWRSCLKKNLILHKCLSSTLSLFMYLHVWSVYACIGMLAFVWAHRCWWKSEVGFRNLPLFFHFILWSRILHWNSEFNEVASLTSQRASGITVSTFWGWNFRKAARTTWHWCSGNGLVARVTNTWITESSPQFQWFFP